MVLSPLLRIPPRHVLLCFSREERGSSLEDSHASLLQGARDNRLPGDPEGPAALALV